MISDEQRYKNSAVNGFFVETADENYIICRWCFLHGFYQNFYWNAAHAVEKYLKAALVLNDRSAKGYQHDIMRLFCDVRGLAGELLPSILVPPNLLNPQIWRTEKMETYLQRLAYHGDPNGRYGLISHYQMRDDLMKADAVVFLLRRLAVRLSDPCVADQLGVDVSMRNQDVLRNDPDWQPRGDIRRPGSSDTAREDETENALLHHNFAFTDNPTHLSGQASGSSARNSWLFLLAGDASNGGVRADDILRANVIEWLTSHVNFPKSIVEELRTAQALLMDRAGPTA